MFSSEISALNKLSARIGNNAALVQGAGGNSSIKVDELMWIKASGTWLSQAMVQEIMVPVKLKPLLDAIARNDLSADSPQQFVLDDVNPHNLRPSIETTLHAVLSHRVVVHAHCVETIAVAVCADVEEKLSQALGPDIDYAYVPYARPGLPLARQMIDRMTASTNVLVLGNHGLVVGADDVNTAEALLMEISQRLRQSVRSAPTPDIEALQSIAHASDYRLPAFDRSHTVACDSLSSDIAGGGSLYPDHVIFLGPGSVVASPDDSIDSICRRESDAGLPTPVSILFAGKGVLMHKDAEPGAEAMAQCLADVTARVPEDAAIQYLSMGDTGELLNWDAEKYRQTLNARSDFKAAMRKTGASSGDHGA